LDVREGVGHVTLNRPDAANSMNDELTEGRFHAMLHCDEDPSVRAVLLGATGRFFCAGGDLKAFAAQGDNLPLYLKQMIIQLHAAMSRMMRMQKPIIAAVHATAAGAGMSLAMACDLVLVAESATFTMAYTGIGLTPDGSSTYFLPRVVGLRRALELTLTNRTLSAQEALDWGIVTGVAPDDELVDQANALATQLASGPTVALGNAKRLLHSGWTETLETQMELEAMSISAMGHTTDAREGIAAFVNKRTPIYRGE
jgi:2-(1,2-epoxy-1,2-dihydrophenyl)acetyl-CoA isomerase